VIELYEYDGQVFPDYLKRGNACQFITPIALQFCQGRGLDVGCGKWPLPGAIGIDVSSGNDAYNLPAGEFDFVFSSHCIEHLIDPVRALEHWRSRIKPGGTLFLYLPHPAMTYWRTTRNRKHLHEWFPEQMAAMLEDLGFVNVLNSERDLAWSFAVCGFVPT
jgi:SAM-dependent methyltransferase